MNFKGFVLRKHRSLTSALSWILRGMVAALTVTLILMPDSWAASRERVLHTFNIATAGDPVSGLALDANRTCMTLLASAVREAAARDAGSSSN